MKMVFKLARVLGFLIMIGGFGYMLYTFQQDMEQWDNMKILGKTMPLAVGFIVVGSLGELVVNSFSNSMIEKKGVETIGTISSLKQTGTYINEQPEIDITIMYKIKGKEVTGKTRQVVSILDIPKLVEGAEVSIKYLPKSPDKLVLKRK